jgi:hypothetical protein
MGIFLKAKKLKVVSGKTTFFVRELDLGGGGFGGF